MPVICPAILAPDETDYKQQIEKIAPVAHRIQIDLTDGDFAPSQTIKPDEAWWPAGIKADIHLMYRHPELVLEAILEHKPNLVIVHAEAEGSFEAFARACKQKGVAVGVALLPETEPKLVMSSIDLIDHVLIFSGDLGKFGGHADLKLLNKSSILKKVKPEIEIGWDGGANDQNVSQLIFGGVDVVNVGGFIQNAADAVKAFQALQRIADETGTT